MHVLEGGKPQVLGRCDIAEEGGTARRGDCPADRPGDVVVARGNVGDKRPEHVKRRALADRLLNLHVGLNLIERHVPRPLDHHLDVTFPGAVSELPEHYKLFNL